MGAGLLKSNPITGGIQEEYEFNLEQAKRTEEDALYGAAQRRREGERLMKEQVAAYGASGIELEGSAKLVIESDLKDAEMEAMNMVYAGKLKRAEMSKKAALAKSGALTQLGTQGLLLGMKGTAGAGASSSGGTTGGNSFAGTQGSSYTRSNSGSMIA